MDKQKLIDWINMRKREHKQKQSAQELGTTAHHEYTAMISELNFLKQCIVEHKAFD